MKKNKLNILIVIIFSIFLTSCQTAKEVFGGKKRSDQGDEFLGEKNFCTRVIRFLLKKKSTSSAT